MDEHRAPDDFVALVKDALENLYDPVQLAGHPLAERFFPDGVAPGTSRVLALRQLLLDYVDKLDPGPVVPRGATQRRAHRMLELRFVQALSFREVMDDLGLSQPQYHREQRHALRALSELLWERFARPSPATGSEAGLEAPAPPTSESIDIDALCRGVLETLAQLARDRSVRTEYQADEAGLMLVGDRTTVRQLLVSLVASLLGEASGGHLHLSAARAGSGVQFVVSYQGNGAPLDAPAARQGLEDARELAASLRGAVRLNKDARRISVDATVPGRSRSLLVIDDNPDIVRLIARSLADHGCRVAFAHSVDEGIEAARREPPDLVLLDVMMPDRDGWDALQVIKNDPATRNVPVLVCTILREERLALSLGADGFLRKPLSLPALLAALDRWAPG